MQKTRKRPAHRAHPGSSWILIASLWSVAAVAQPANTVHIEGLEWATRTNGAEVLWREAAGFCSDFEFDGHADWRLPTLEELERLHDPAQPAGIDAAIQLDGCCLWSATSLEELPAEEGSSGIALAPSRYHWGLVFDGGIRYYSIDLQPDGRALCVRAPD